MVRVFDDDFCNNFKIVKIIKVFTLHWNSKLLIILIQFKCTLIVDLRQVIFCFSFLVTIYYFYFCKR